MASCSGNGSKGHHKFTLNVNESYVSGGAENYSTLAWSLVLSPIGNGYDWYYQNTVPVSYNVKVNGVTVASGNIMSYDGTSTVTVASGTIQVTHNNDGSKTAPFSFSVSSLDLSYLTGSASGSGSITLTTIPRYVNITGFSVAKRNETSVTFKYTADATCDYGRYSIDNGATWKDLPANNIVSGLSANTSYDFKMKLRRKDSQLWTETGIARQTTHNYPYCTNSPDFIIGNPVKLDFYNPLGREISVELIGNGDAVIGSWNGTGDFAHGFNDSYSVASQYESIPNDINSTYKVRVTYGDSVKTRNNKNTYSINESECLPTFLNAFAYKDTNTKVTDVTGNDQILVNGLSQLSVMIDADYKMEAKNGATPSHYVVSVGNLSKNIPYVENDIDELIGTVTAEGSNTTISVRAYDSRGLSTLQYLPVAVHDYKKPVINAEVKRLNNFENETTLKVSGTYSLLTIGDSNKNSLTKIEYRYRETGGEWSSLDNLITTVNAEKYTCNDVVFSLDNSKSFEFEIQVTDKLDVTTLTAFVDVGQAIFFISSNKKKCYINGVEVPTFENVYPVGSVYCGSTNTNPSEIYGGEWELIDKGFKTGSTEITQDATEYLSSFEVASIRTGQTVRLRIKLITAKEINDTSVTLGTVDLTSHGLQETNGSYFLYGVFGDVAMSDGGDATVTYDFNNTGVLEVNDCLNINGTHSLPADSTLYINAVVTTSQSRMIDEFCDKFYWKRIT